jgi:hypothetical protein
MQHGGPVRQIGLSYPARICKRLKSSGIDSKESIAELFKRLQIRAQCC